MWSNVVWDPDKDRINQAKHGISFHEARTVIRDPLSAVDDDASHAGAEARYLVQGTSDRGRLLVVVITEVSDDTVRIISARRPSRRERHAYEDR